jgi:hypothetical protein
MGDQNTQRDTLNTVVLEIYRLMKKTHYEKYHHLNLDDCLDFQDFLDEMSSLFLTIIKKPGIFFRK